MFASDAIGTNAIGTSGNSVSTPSINFSCTLTSSSTTTASLTTAIKLSAILASAALITATLSSGSAHLSANLSSVSSVTATTLTSLTRLNAVLSSQNTIVATLTTSQEIPMFTPSLARTIFVQATSPIFTGGKWWTLTDPKKPRALKDPDATIDITFDWSNWLDDIGSVQISDVTFTLNGVSSVGSFSDGTRVTVFVAGGTPGSSSTVACKIKTLTTPTRTDERTIYLDIADE